MSLSLFSHSTSRLIVARLISQRGMATTTASPLEELVEQGVTVIKTNTKKEVVEGWREMAKEIEEGLKEQAGVIGVGREKGYREVFQSDEGRFHFPLNHLLPVRDVRDVPTQADFVFAEQKKKLVNETLGLQTQLMDDMSKHVEQHAHDLFCSILSDSYEKSGQELRVANPSSPAHKWHTNVSPLFGTEELEGNFLPPYALTVLVPLQTQGEKLGLTQFACGSQKLTPSFERTTPEGRYPNDFSIDSLLQRSSSLAQLTCEGGDLAVVDGRVLQRMRGNRGQERRYMVVFDFCRWWFRLHPQEGQGRSLFEE